MVCVITLSHRPHAEAWLQWSTCLEPKGKQVMIGKTYLVCTCYPTGTLQLSTEDEMEVKCFWYRILLLHWIKSFNFFWMTGKSTSMCMWDPHVYQNHASLVKDVSGLLIEMGIFKGLATSVKCHLHQFCITSQINPRGVKADLQRALYWKPAESKHIRNTNKSSIFEEMDIRAWP